MPNGEKKGNNRGEGGIRLINMRMLLEGSDGFNPVERTLSLSSGKMDGLRVRPTGSSL